MRLIWDFIKLAFSGTPDTNNGRALQMFARGVLFCVVAVLLIILITAYYIWDT